MKKIDPCNCGSYLILRQTYILPLSPVTTKNGDYGTSRIRSKSYSTLSPKDLESKQQTFCSYYYDRNNTLLTYIIYFGGYYHIAGIIHEFLVINRNNISIILPLTSPNNIQCNL